MSAIKRDTDDALFSKLVRERADWACEYPGCGKFFVDETAGLLHCSHVFGRRRAATRHDPDNALALCVYHHKFVGENPLIHADIVRTKLGEERYQALMIRANSVLRLTPRQKAGRRLHLKREWDIMVKRRELGEPGYIQFKAFDPSDVDDEAPALRKPKKKKPTKFKRKVNGQTVGRAA